MQNMKQLASRMAARWQLYLLLLIPLVYILIFAYIPMGGVQIAFRQYDVRYGILNSEWVGMKYFFRFFESYQLQRVLSNTLYLALYSLFANFPLPICFALLLNSFPLVRYRKLIQTVTYIPHFISTVVMVGILMQLFNSRIGVYGLAYSQITGKQAPDVFGMANAFSHIYVWSGVWQSLGWNSIIYFAALSSNDISLHEAAQIDGASRFQRILHIDLPCILPTASILLILSAGGIMSAGFEKVFLLQNDLNLKTSEVISTYVYKVGLVTGGGDFSFATAIGLFNSLINFILLTLVNTICRKLGGSTLW